TLRALALRGRAEIHVVRGELEPARRDLDEVGEIRSGLADPVGEAEDLRIAAAVRAAEGDVPAADRALREVIRRAEQQGRPQLLAEATRDLAVVLRGAGRSAEAQTAARRARATFTRLGAEGEIRHLAGQGWEPDFAAELRGSLAPLHVAQELAMQDNDMATVGRCANNLGIIATMQGDYPRAIGAYTRAIAAYERAHYHRGIAESRHNLGITYREQGQLDHALQAADAAVRDAEWLDDRG